MEEKFEAENTSKYAMLTGDKWGSYIVKLHERAAVSDGIEEHSPGTLDSMFGASHEMRLAEVNNAGVASLFKKRLKY